MIIVELFHGRDIRPIAQFIKYAITGCLGTGFQLVLFNLLSKKTIPALQHNDPIVKLLKWKVIEVNNHTRARNSIINNCITFLFANILVYSINIYWVFESGRYNRIIEIGMFYFAALFSLAIGTGTMAKLIEKYGAKTNHAFCVNILVSVIINYIARKFIIFQS